MKKTKIKNTETIGNVRNIGLKVEWPSKECNDKNCPFHSHQKIRGRLLQCKMLKTDPFKSAIVIFERIHPLPKYERYEKRTSKLHVHNPPCINAQPGNQVLIAETKPISKTKSFVIIEVKHENK